MQSQLALESKACPANRIPVCRSMRQPVCHCAAAECGDCKCAATQDLRLDHYPLSWVQGPLSAHELPVLRLGSLTQVTTGDALMR